MPIVDFFLTVIYHSYHQGLAVNQMVFLGAVDYSTLEVVHERKEQVQLKFVVCWHGPQLLQLCMHDSYTEVCLSEVHTVYKFIPLALETMNPSHGNLN